VNYKSLNKVSCRNILIEMASSTIYIVRPAKKEDCSEIARLIQELSDYEQLPDAPKIDPRGTFRVRIFSRAGYELVPS